MERHWSYCAAHEEIDSRIMPTRIAVLASGRGSNARALIEHQESLGDLRAGVVSLVLSDRDDAAVLEFARGTGIPAAQMPRPASGYEMLTTLHEHRIEMIVLAGYLRLVPIEVVRAFTGRIVNVHPALLPAFGGKGMYGRRVHEAVLAAGVRVTGATVHFVDEQYDRGAIIAQWPVPVRADDTPDSLAERVLSVEHLLLSRAVEAVAASRVKLGADGRALGAFGALPESCAFTIIASAEDVLGRHIAGALSG